MNAPTRLQPRLRAVAPSTEALLREAIAVHDEAESVRRQSLARIRELGMALWHERNPTARLVVPLRVEQVRRMVP